MNHSSRATNDHCADDSILFLPDNDDLLLIISLADLNPPVHQTEEWKEVQTKNTKKKNRISPIPSSPASLHKVDISPPTIGTHLHPLHPVSKQSTQARRRSPKQSGMLSNYFAILNKGGAEPAGQQHPMTKFDSSTTTNSILQLIPHKITTTNNRRTGHRKEQKPIMTRRNNHILRSILIITLLENPSNSHEGTDSKVFYYDIHICQEGNN